MGQGMRITTASKALAAYRQHLLDAGGRVLSGKGQRPTKTPSIRAASQLRRKIESRNRGGRGSPA